jgi:serine/threonine protein kinase
MGNCLDGGNKAVSGSVTGTKPKKMSTGINNHKKRGDSKTIQTGLLQSHTMDVYSKYNEVEVLGSGSMGHVAKVFLVDAATRSRRSTNDANSSMSSIVGPSEGRLSSSGKPVAYALKSIQMARISASFREELKNEIDILNAMDHPNIVKLHEVINHKEQIYMILELCDGGDLYTRLPYTEKDSAYITGKLLSAIKYMHDHKIVHRDLKFENIMFENKSAEAEIKVIDFGLSKKFVSSKMGIMREGVGTLYSMAPQVLQGIYTSQADMWSVGVLAYMLLSSHRPFYSKKRNVMIDKIMRCDYNFKKSYWILISSEAKDFINKLLVMDPTVRYRAQQAQAHTWMKKEFKIDERGPTETTTSRVNDILSAYKNTLPLKKLALNVIAHRSTTDEIVNLRKAFDKFDAANNGVISSEEFKAALQEKCSYSETEIQEMFNSIDVNQNGHIMYTEFIAAALEAQGQLDEDRIAEAFDRFDCDDSGFISKENMLEFLGETGVTSVDIEKIVGGPDLDSNGQVSYEEFLAMFRSEDKATNTNLVNGLKGYNLGGGLVTNEDESDDEKIEDLIGLDAVIPGGKHESN